MDDSRVVDTFTLLQQTIGTYVVCVFVLVFMYIVETTYLMLPFPARSATNPLFQKKSKLYKSVRLDVTEKEKEKERDEAYYLLYVLVVSVILLKHFGFCDTDSR